MRIILVRHSFADYEQAFKSAALTKEGVRLAETTAEELAEMTVRQHVQIVSSPAKRALATAERFCEAISFPAECIHIESQLADTMVHDTEGRAEFFKKSLEELGLRDLHELDGRYLAGDPRFDEHPELFEPRNVVANRVFGWLGQRVQEVYDRAKNDFLVAVTHAEVMNLLLAGFEVKEQVRQCEMLDLRLERGKSPGCVTIAVAFRGERREMEFQVPARSFGQQFGPWWRD
jgi:broad specificity phosphatase PhoE